MGSHQNRDSLRNRISEIAIQTAGAGLNPSFPSRRPTQGEREMKIEYVYGHVCNYCYKQADPAKPTKDNPLRTDFCMVCGHRGEGLKTSAVKDWRMWGIIRPTLRRFQ